MKQESLPEGLRETLAVFDVAGDPWTTTEVADNVDLSRRTAYNRLERLVEHNQLKTKKVGASGRVWWLPQTAAEESGDGDTETEPTERTTRAEQQFRSLVEVTEEYAIFLLDPEGYVQTWNPGAARIKGYDADDIIGEHFSTFYTEADRRADIPEKNLNAAAREGSTQDVGWRLRKDGSRFWANVTITANRNDDGALIGYAKVTRDMTDQREYEEQLQEEKAFIESLLDTQQDLLYAFDTDGQFLRWNDSLREVTGYTDAEIEEMRPAEFIADEAADELTAAIEQVLEHGDKVTAELPLVTAEGDEIPYEFTGGAITNENDEIVGLTGIGRDISDRKARERQLERQRDELKSELDEIFERISDGFYALDDHFRVTYVNDNAQRLLGLEESSIIKQDIQETVSLTDQVESALQKAFEEQTSVQIEDYFEPLDTWFEYIIYPSESGLSVQFRDITERKERERILKQYETITETASDVILTIDDKSQIHSVNPAVEEMFGYTPDELVGESLTTLIPDRLADAHRDGIAQYLRTGTRTLDWSNVELPGVRADGSEVPLAISFSEAEYDGQRFFTGIVRDITERKERERELAYRKALLEAQAESTIHGLLVVDSARNVRYHNERFLELWDIPDSVAATRSDETLIEYVHDQLSNPGEFRETVEYLYEHPGEESRDTIELVDGQWFDRYSAPIVADGTQHGRLWVFRDITDQKERERALERQRTELARLNQFNELVQDLVHAVVEESTQTEIEQTVCDQLATSEFYQAAWIGDQAKTTATITPRVSAGVELDAVPTVTTASTDGESPSDLAARAFDTRDACVAQQPIDEPHVGEDHDPSLRADIESALAVPITYGDVLYGVLVVYATQETAFGDRQQASFVDLGETIGFAIAAAERKEALVAERVFELTLSIRDPDQFFTLAAIQCDATVTLDGIAVRGDDAYLAYFTVTGASPEAIRGLAEQPGMPDHVRVVNTSETSILCEVGVTDSSLITIVADYGGTVTDITAQDDHGTVRLELPRTADVSRVLDALRATGADVELQAKRTVDRPIQTDNWFQEAVTDRLTDKQRHTLEAAYHAGFFEQPRDSTGEEIAESMDISPSTFHQHLRVGLGKLLSPIAEPPKESA
jgi:PAS domain S-box-containing protein